MSLILDALKKSEAERLRGQVPNLLSPLPSAPSPTQTQNAAHWPWLILVAILLSALVFGYFYTRPATIEAPEIAVAPVLDPAPVQADTPPASTDKAPANIAPEPPPTPIEKPQIPVVETTAPAATTTSTPELPQTAFETPAEPRIAGISEMPVDQRQQLPALKLSMHVYSAEASKRFAIIDGQRVNEGSVLGPAVVEEIRQDGVVLSVQGQSYLLPRP